MIDTKKKTCAFSSRILAPVKPVNDQLPASEPDSATFICLDRSFYLSITVSKLS